MPYFIVTGQFRTEDYWDGVVSPNSGATIIQAGGGLAWSVDESLISFNIQAPVFFEANMIGEETSVDSRTGVWVVSLSVRKMFDLFGLFGEKNKEE